MNDCFWFWIKVCGDCKNYGGCKNRLSVNSDKGGEMLEEYTAEVEESLIVVRKKWLALKGVS